MTTGASNDIQRATEIARNMVTKWGFSDKLGTQAYTEEEGPVFLGRTVNQSKTLSDQTVRLIDEEVHALIRHSYERARKLLVENLDTLHALAAALIEHETLSGEQLDDIMAGRALRAAADGEDDRPGSTPGKPKNYASGNNRRGGGLIGPPLDRPA